MPVHNIDRVLGDHRVATIDHGGNGSHVVAVCHANDHWAAPAWPGPARQMPNPKEPLSATEKRVFGENAIRHPITGEVLEQGSGALSEKAQAVNQTRTIAQTEPAAAEQMRRQFAEAEKRIVDELAATAAKLEAATGLDDGAAAAAALRSGLEAAEGVRPTGCLRAS